MRRAMCPTVLSLLLAATWASSCVGQTAGKAVPPPANVVSQPRHTVHLDDAADLEHLRQTNFAHYLRARKILAAANEICRPGPPKTRMARFAAADPECGALWMTSYPPKKRLSFYLDHVHYLALVTVTAVLGKVVKADDAKR
jgi:hypothetical protein